MVEREDICAVEDEKESNVLVLIIATGKNRRENKSATLQIRGRRSNHIFIKTSFLSRFPNKKTPAISSSFSTCGLCIYTDVLLIPWLIIQETRKREIYVIS